MRKSKIPSATLKPGPNKSILQNACAPGALVDFRTLTVSLVDSRTLLVSLGVSRRLPTLSVTLVDFRCLNDFSRLTDYETHVIRGKGTVLLTLKLSS